MQTHNVLVIGSGGREHAIGWKLSQSPQVGELFFAPGNAGTAQIGRNVDVPCEPVTSKVVADLDLFCRENQVDLVVIGPEDPLAQGLSDKLKAPGRHVFGPIAAAARLEGDKDFAKQVMRQARVATADSRTFTVLEQAREYLNGRELDVVIKAAGLCKGKGVIVPSSVEEAQQALVDILEKKIFGEAGAKVVIEDRLSGPEVSILALVDGSNFFVFDPGQDHKRAHEGDLGPNTGGMGVYCPAPVLSEQELDNVMRDVLVPTVDALRRDGVDYQGVLYAGLMLTPAGPKVLEFNCRFGDPETQTIMMRLQGDLYESFVACCEGRLDQVDLSSSEDPCVCVVMASGGYPGDYAKGLPITGIDEAEKTEGVRVFHAGTKLGSKGEVLTAGGRVLNVCATGATLKEARDKANAACEQIQFDGAFFRRDIGHRAIPAE